MCLRVFKTLNSAKLGAVSNSLANSSQHPTTLCVKNLFLTSQLNFPWPSFMLFPWVLSLLTRERSTCPSASFHKEVEYLQLPTIPSATSALCPLLKISHLSSVSCEEWICEPGQQETFLPSTVAWKEVVTTWESVSSAMSPVKGWEKMDLNCNSEVQIRY